jgi:hypothetical protein
VLRSNLPKEDLAEAAAKLGDPEGREQKDPIVDELYLLSVSGRKAPRAFLGVHVL